MGKNAVYALEDLHCAYWPKFGGGLRESANFFNVAKGLVDKLNADHTEGQVPTDAFTRETFAIAFYDSMVVFDKGQIPGKGAIEVEAGKVKVTARSGGA
jgi:hypothetical protein